MKERPILFSASMVKALLAGNKTQTRRVVKPQPPEGLAFSGWIICSTHKANEGCAAWHDAVPLPAKTHLARCPYGTRGDRLWVKETWFTYYYWNEIKPTLISEKAAIHYAATSEEYFTGRKLRPSLFMRRWMSRITLEIVSVRVERLNDISEADAVAEGIEGFPYATGDGPEIAYGTQRLARMVMSSDPREAYRRLWESINGPDSWAANPWVWVVEFKRVEGSK